MSLSKALEHGAIHANRNLKIFWIEAQHIESESHPKYEECWS